MEKQELDAIRFCKDILSKVSRSFALTIPMLDDSIYKPIMITYLQDRLLDNFEDEVKNISIKKRKYLMNQVVKIFDPDNSKYKKSLQKIMNKSYLLNDKKLKELTENADLLKQAYDSLDDKIKKISFKWLQEMNQGMQKYLTGEVNTFKDLDEYCYYVAGTVGGFLTESIIYKENLKSPQSDILMENFKDAGLFLQKVNLIRDIKKDIENREKNYWPLKSFNISEKELLDPARKDKAMDSLDKMILNVKNHIKGLLNYYKALPDSLPGYKKFYCVNNALGLATIDKIENNTDIFYGKKKVKVSKIQFLRIIGTPQKMFVSKCNEHLAALNT